MDNGDTIKADGEWDSLDAVYAALSLDLSRPFVTITGGDGSKTLLMCNRIVWMRVRLQATIKADER